MPRLVMQTREQSHKLGSAAEVITGTLTIDASQRRGAALCMHMLMLHVHLHMYPCFDSSCVASVRMHLHN